MSDKLTPQQLREKFVDLDKRISAGEYFNTHRVYVRSMAFQFFGEYMPQYDSLSKEEREEFGVNVVDLTKKVSELFKSNQ